MFTSGVARAMNQLIETIGNKDPAALATILHKDNNEIISELLRSNKAIADVISCGDQVIANVSVLQLGVLSAMLTELVMVWYDNSEVQ